MASSSSILVHEKNLGFSARTEPTMSTRKHDKAVAVVSEASDDEYNPQEASNAPNGHTHGVNRKVNENETTPASQLNLDGRENDKENKGSRKRQGRDRRKACKDLRGKRKRGRHVRLANVDNDAGECMARNRLPRNQYATRLRRRAVRKPEVQQPHLSPTSSASDSPSSTGSRRSIFRSTVVEPALKTHEESLANKMYDQEYGDVSLGMKLTIVGGRVIVQALNALSDGRASPAQLTGVIRRGDVLLSVNKVSLVNMPLTQLVDGLKPLSTPLDGGSYQRTLHLRFAVGEGMTLLNKSEAQLANKPKTADGATDMFSLSQFIPQDVPMVVDQLSGLPMLPPQADEKANLKEKKVLEPILARAASVAVIAREDSISIEQHISEGVARQVQRERQKFMSAFFSSVNKFSLLIRAPSIASINKQLEQQDAVRTRSQILEEGERALMSAKALCYTMEEIDKGKDSRSFKKWNSQISLRSRASSRRKYFLETEPQIDNESSNDGSATSSASDVLDDVDGDELLLGLAAHDEIWRRQVLVTLREATEELNSNGEPDNDILASEEETKQSLDTAISMELGSFLFGAQMSRILTKKKRSLALPPEEVTSVLFDLTTNLVTVVPDQISLKGSANEAADISLTHLIRKSQSSRDDKTVLAAHFVSKEALPAWLQSFRPLPWEQRRVLWPRHKLMPSGDSHTIGTSSQAFTEENLTLDSDSTGDNLSSKQPRNLRQQIEDIELDVQTRAETCYLVTVYFTQILLPDITRNANEEKNASEQILSETHAVNFVKRFGAYLNLHTSLVSAASLEADGVIACLLRLAKHDLGHQQAMKEISKANVLLLYEPVMLSAILKRLRAVRQETRLEHRRALLELCASSFPEVRPWQVRRACLLGPDSSEKDNEFRDLYYGYLCHLLHPLEGHEDAKRDGRLVEEWCKLSVEPTLLTIEPTGDISSEERLKNFYAVASPHSTDHDQYARNLVLLLNLSMKLWSVDLALDIASEIIDKSGALMHETSFSSILDHLRTIATASVSGQSFDEANHIDGQRLQRVLSLFHKIASTPRFAANSFTVSNELNELVISCRKPRDQETPIDKEMVLIELLAKNCNPKYFLEMLSMWTRSGGCGLPSHSLLFVQQALVEGARTDISQGLSGSLLLLRGARQLSGIEGKTAVLTPLSSSRDGDTTEKRGNIWNRMREGNAVIDK